MEGFNEKEKKKRISFEVTNEKHHEIKMAATALGLTIKGLIEKALKSYAKNSYNIDLNLNRGKNED